MTVLNTIQSINEHIVVLSNGKNCEYAQIVHSEPDYFPKQQLLQSHSNLNLYQMAKSWMYQIERTCRRQIMISLLERVENTVGKGENASYQHFLLFSQCFPKLSPIRSLKSGLCGKDLNKF